LAERWHNKLTLQGQSLAERYTKHGLTVICDLDISVPKTEVLTSVRGNDKPVVEGETLARFIYCANVVNSRKFSVSNQEPVLVFDIETVKGPDGLAIPSLVRLYNFDNEVEDFFGGVLFQSAIDGSFKAIRGILDGELCVRSPFENNFMHRVIEGAAKIVDGVAENEQESLWKGRSRFDLYHIASSLQIVLDMDNVRVFFREGSDLDVNIADVMLGPFDL
jgi:hypothetical protein